jgi:hypothetical protein
MPTTAKHPKRSKSTSSRLEPARKRRIAGHAAVSRAQDLAARKKIGKTLDREAFDAQQERNAAPAAAHWETAE